MLSRCCVRRCLVRLAAASAAEFAELTAPDALDAREVMASSSPAPTQLWIDDTAESKAAYEAHIRSPEYKELHRPAVTNAAMGLFGGEPGFEKSYRVWVDPDRPQMKHVYNQTALAKNLRYARYGYFKRDMRLLDVDKLVKHARMLPTPTRMLTDFLYQRVPLSDRSCAAFLRYQLDQLVMLDEWSRGTSLAVAEEIFERMAVTNIPPVEVGVETHAEMIRCCAVAKAWEKGWDIYLQRAREMEEEEIDKGEMDFVLDTYLFDAVMDLCVACERPAEGAAILEEAIRRHLRPRASMLEKAMVLAAVAAEDPATSGKGPVYYEQMGLDAWALFDFYELPRTTATIEAYLRMCSMYGRPTLALEALSLADASGLKISLPCYHWALHALRDVGDFGDFIMDTFGQLAPRGLTPDYILFTVAFAYCAVNKDGELALALYDQHYARFNINPTPEMTLLFAQACAQCAEPRMDMLARCEDMIDQLESVGSTVDCTSDIYDQYIELAAHLGAVGSAFSNIKKLVSFGKPLTTRQMNSLLLANSNSAPPNGGVSMTAEIASIYQLLRIPVNDDTVHCLGLCLEAFGATPELEAWLAAMLAQREEMEGGTLGADADTTVRGDSPAKIRVLRVDWHIRPRDTVLQRYGQTHKIRGPAAVGHMVGTTVPFGRAPGERMV